MDKGTAVVYIDPAGKEHSALVFAKNGLHEGFSSLVYVDKDAPEADNRKVVFDVPHMGHSSKDELNPDLPRTVLNAWRESDAAKTITDMQKGIVILQAQLKEKSEALDAAAGKKAKKE